MDFKIRKNVNQCLICLEGSRQDSGQTEETSEQSNDFPVVTADWFDDESTRRRRGRRAVAGRTVSGSDISGLDQVSRRRRVSHCECE